LPPLPCQLGHFMRLVRRDDGTVYAARQDAKKCPECGAALDN